MSHSSLLETSMFGDYLDCGRKGIDSDRTNKSGWPLRGGLGPIWSRTRTPGKSLRSRSGKTPRPEPRHSFSTMAEFSELRFPLLPSHLGVSCGSPRRRLAHHP